MGQVMNLVKWGGNKLWSPCSDKENFEKFN